MPTLKQQGQQEPKSQMLPQRRIKVPNEVRVFLRPEDGKIELSVFLFCQLLEDHPSLAAEEHNPRSLHLSFPSLIPFSMSCLHLVIDMNSSIPIRICAFRCRV